MSDETRSGLFVVTPSCGDSFCSEYVRGNLELANLAAARQLPVGYLFHTGGSHICIARNYCADSFLKTDHEAMLFIDDDIGFKGRYALELYDSGLSLVGGTYARKQLDLRSGFNAALNTGSFEAFEKALFNYSTRLRDDGPIRYLIDKKCMEATHLPTGFLFIRREVLDKVQEAFPESRYDDGTYNFFGHPDKGTQFGEDYYFCEHAIKAGVTPYLHVGMELNHYGKMKFPGQAWV